MPDSTRRPVRDVNDLNPERRAQVEAFRARQRTAEARARERADRDAIRAEFPPAVPDEDLAATLAQLRGERERQGLSLTDMAERTGIDRATISKLETGRQPNPTLATLARYARALGKQLRIQIVP